jgi:hypothetical protein
MQLYCVLYWGYLKLTRIDDPRKGYLSNCFNWYVFCSKNGFRRISIHQRKLGEKISSCVLNDRVGVPSLFLVAPYPNQVWCSARSCVRYVVSLPQEQTQQANGTPSRWDLCWHGMGGNMGTREGVTLVHGRFRSL